MSGGAAEILALVLLGLTLAVAVTRPLGLPEAIGAVPAAALTVGLGIVPWPQLIHVAHRLGPTIGFLGAILVLSDLCEREGVFEFAGWLISTRSRGDPRRLLGLVVIIASLTTAILSLDATIVLLTPVVFVTAGRLRIRERPALYACAHLANTASLLLPVSNLTNLLALRTSGLSFAGFGRRMALPWIAGIGVEWLILNRYFRADIQTPGRSRPPAQPPAVPSAAFLILGATLVGFLVSSVVGLDPAIVAGGGAALLAAVSWRRGRLTGGAVVRGVNLGFLAFVAGLAIVVEGAQLHGLGAAVTRLVPSGDSLPALLGIAVLGAVVANLINNLPAALVLLPAAAAGGSTAVLAMLIGVNVGPNLTHVGSLATLLWRRSLRAHGTDAAIGDFIRVGILTVPPSLVASVAALWLSSRS